MSRIFDELDLTVLRRRHSIKWRAFPPDVLPSFVAEMDYPVAEPIQRAVRAAIERDGDFGYVDMSPLPLAQAFTGWAERTFGWHVPLDRVVLLPDVMQGIAVCLRELSGRGDGVVLDTPVYPPFFEAIRATGRTAVANPVVLRDRRWQLDFAGLERAFRDGARVYLLCNPHNPVGRVLAGEELRQVAALAAAHNVLVIADEIHAPLVYPGFTHTPLASLPEAGGLAMVTLMSASKGWNIPGLKCAVGVPNSPDLGKAFATQPTYERVAAGVLGVDATVAAFAEGGPWLAEALNHLDRNRRLLAELLAEHLPSVGYVQPEGTYLAWLDCRELGLADPYAVFLSKGRVALGDGKGFGPGGEGFVRLNFATSKALLTKTVERMAHAVMS